MKFFLTFLGLMIYASILLGQSDAAVLQSIRQSTDSSSQVMNNLSYLSDVFGARLMGTPQYYNAAVWAQEKLEEWGVEKVWLESFDNDHIGWSVEDFKVELSSPNYALLNAYPLAFSRSSYGTQVGTPILIDHFSDIYELAGQLKGKIVLLKGYYRPVTNVEQPMATRLTDDILNKAAANHDPNDVIIGYHSRRSSVDVFGQRARTKLQRAKFFEFCAEQGAIAVFEPSRFPYGILHVDGNRAVPSFSKKMDIRPLPSFVVSNEHFGRLVRLINLGIEPKLKINLTTKFYKEPAYNVNLIAEIAGTDTLLKNELVIIGAHLDSWHSGTGAVDNASNCVVMMEAMRLLSQLNLRTKRTIRLVLWGGEEQVFAGSAAYVNERVGDLKKGTPKMENDKISAYLNLDNGAGMIRGVYLFGNDKIAPFFAEYLAPFSKSQTLTIQNANQTDHELFDYFNVPAFQFIQDPLDYMTAIHHTNLDVYEYAPSADLRYNAELIAYLTYRIAQAKDKLPRKQFNSPIPSRKGNALFQLEGHKTARKVSLVGDFNNWNMFGTPLYQTATGWECKIDLPVGRYFYKYIVDGNWTADPSTPKNKLVKDGKGHGGLTIKYIK